MSKQRKKRTGKAGRRKGSGCLSRLILFLLIVFALVAASTIFFKISRVNVYGNERYSSEQIRATTGIGIGDNLLFLNKIAATRGVLSELPYVNDIRISRQLPDTLLIEIVEAEEFAHIRSGVDIWYIDDTGKLLRKNGESTKGLIEVTGVELDKPEEGAVANFGEQGGGKLDILENTFETLVGEGIEDRVQQIDLSEVYGVKMSFDDRFLVKLGMPESLEYKLQYLLKAIGELETNAKGTMDLSELMESGIARFIPDS